MSDLISRSALLKEFAEKTPFGCGTIGIKFVDDLIKAQPIAYDVESVMAELEKQKEIAEKEMEECIFKALPYHDSTEGKVIGIKTAIDIVKGDIE